MNDLSINNLFIFGETNIPDYVKAWRLYEDGLRFNNQINFDETVKVNENFFIGKQWEGVQSNGLPCPTINIIKRVVSFTSATITSDNIRGTASLLENTVNTNELKHIPTIINDEFEALTERNNLPKLVREFVKNAAIDGDACMYTYWDPDAISGQKNKGLPKTDVIENSRVFFGNPNDRNKENQPWIIISTRMLTRLVRRKAKKNGINTYMSITADDEGNNRVDSAKYVSDKCTDLLLLWRAEEDTDFGEGGFAKEGEICAFEFTHNSAVKKPWALGITTYPIVWLCWDRIVDCYHGQAMVTGLIPNQIAINKMHAYTILNAMKNSVGKVLYDNTRIKYWDNRVGSAIGMAGSVEGAAKIMDPPLMNPQISQYIELLTTQTEQSLGATSVALGDTRPDNTSAIIALQRAAATPSESTKQDLYCAIEDQYRIYLEFMSEYYGKRMVDIPATAKEKEAIQFAQQFNPELIIPKTVPEEFDFKLLKDHPVLLKLDVGASTYYSEIASMQTLDNLLMQGKISTKQYLERIPDDYVRDRRALIQEIEQAEQMSMNGMPPAMAQPMQQQEASGVKTTAGLEKMPINGGKGYSALTRKINETGNTRAAM